MFTAILTTADKYEEDIRTKSGLIERTRGTLKEWQRVVAIGSCVNEVKVGDLIWVDPTRYEIKKHTEGSLKDGIISDNVTVGYKFNIFMVNGEPHLLLQDRDVRFVIEDYEEEEDWSASIELPSDKKIIV
jgi:hypothetical protein